MRNFRSLHLAAAFYRASKSTHLKGDIRSQLIRASSSICLNLAEGRGRSTRRDQLRHFHIAFGSARECQAILIIEDLTDSDLWRTLDKATASIYKLIQNAC